MAGLGRAIDAHGFLHQRNLYLTFDANRAQSHDGVSQSKEAGTLASPLAPLAGRPPTAHCTLKPVSSHWRTTKEDSMFARHVSMRLKPNTLAEFNRTLENDVIPLLKKQKGFRDEVVLTLPSGTEAVGISLWDNKENAEAYNRESYSEVQKLLAKVLEGTPQVQTYEVASSTFHKITARATA
jgi:quinol monooxygenase YgiN